MRPSPSPVTVCCPAYSCASFLIASREAGKPSDERETNGTQDLRSVPHSSEAFRIFPVFPGEPEGWVLITGRFTIHTPFSITDPKASRYAVSYLFAHGYKMVHFERHQGHQRGKKCHLPPWNLTRKFSFSIFARAGASPQLHEFLPLNTGVTRVARPGSSPDLPS